MIEISTLGRGVIHCDGVPDEEIPPHSQKCALLLFLAMEGPVTRGQLLKLFWPDRERGKARHALSQALYALRREFGEDCLEISGDRVGLKPDAARLDAKELEAAQAEGAWERVLQLYQGPFLERFALPGAPEFVLGVINLRGRIVSVVDLGRQLGTAPSEITSASRILVIQFDGVSVGFLVDAATSVIKVPGDAIDPPPDMIGEIKADYLEGVAKLEERLAILLNLRKVLTVGQATAAAATANSVNEPIGVEASC